MLTFPRRPILLFVKEKAFQTFIHYPVSLGHNKWMFDRIMFFFSQIFELLHIYIRGPHKCVLYFRWSDVSQFWAVFATNHKQSYATLFNSGSVPQLQRLLFSNLLVLFTESRKRYGAKVVFLFCLQSCKGLLQTIAFSKRIRLLFTV